MRKAPQRAQAPSTAVLPAWQMRCSCVLCTSHRPCHSLQRVSTHPVVTVMKGDFGELQAKDYQTSLADTSTPSVLDQCQGPWLHPHYLTQTQLGDGTFFALIHLGDNLGITEDPQHIQVAACWVTRAGACPGALLSCTSFTPCRPRRPVRLRHQKQRLRDPCAAHRQPMQAHWCAHRQGRGFLVKYTPVLCTGM